MSADKGLEGLRARIKSLPDVAPQVRDTLLKAIHEMVDAEEANPAVVSGTLLEYGKYLESVGRLELAAHVCQTMIEALDSPGRCLDPVSAATAHMRYGLVARLLGDFSASSNAYQRAEYLAEQAGNLTLVLRTQVGMANTLRARGNLGEAEALLDQTVARASQSGLTNAESIALHSRGAIRDQRERYTEAMVDYFKAHELTSDASERELIIGDLALAAGKAGYLKIARDAHRVLTYTARNPFARSSALVNLLELAASEGNLKDFELLRTQIQACIQQSTISAEHAIHATLYTAYGIERFGSREDAIAAYNTVITQANDIGLHQIAFKANQGLTALLTGTIVNNEQVSHDPPDTIHYIADAIAEWGMRAESAV
jgi:tetratricopeptide (TPR) repeat protein